MTLSLCPITRAEASAFVRRFHRHHKPAVGDVFRVAVHNGARIVGCATVGRPVSRLLDDGRVLEINRLCVEEGHPNAASMLLGACKRAAWALGYTRLVTYTLASEGGASLRAAGYRVVGERADRSWNMPGRPRVEVHTGQKLMWEAV